MAVGSPAAGLCDIASIFWGPIGTGSVMTISTRQMYGEVREGKRASKPYVRGPIMRQDAHMRQEQAPRDCEIPWYQRLGAMLVVAVGIGGQILVLWIVGQILLLWLGT